ncbi:MAG TPA: DNA recombination protein RmuC, partial [Patescibacteria group bacterium]
MITGILIGAGIAGLVCVFFLIWQKRQQPNLEASFEQHAQKALGMMMQEVIKASREQLGAEKREISETIAKDLQTQTNTFKEVAQSLRIEIDARQREIRQLEEDRNKKYGQISQALTDYKSLTEELRGSTEQLKRVLSSNQQRGSWGEMQAEKILEAAGMVAGQHYAKQQPIEGFTGLRPDFTLFLPNKMELYVDVKFPLTALQEVYSSTTKEDQERYFKRFGDDLRDRIKEAGKYVIDKSNCVDYVILFVPSESVFEIINKHFPAIVDASFSQQVILVSPHSFFAVVRTIQESYTHFYYEQNLKEILGYLQQTLQQFERFKGEFADVG